MKRLFAIRHLVVLAVAAATTLMVSCFKDDIIELPSGKPSLPTASEYIAFQADAQWAEEDVISRNAATRNRVGKHDLISEDGELSLPMGVYVEEGICGTTDNGKTRGAVLKAIGNSFTVWASLTNGETTALFFPAEGVAFEDDGTSYKSDPAYFWPGAGTFSFTAVANAPDTGFTPNLNTAGTALESFTYTVPADATAQNDIVLATLKDVDGGANATQALNFKHIMSAVNVQIGAVSAGTIKSITLKGVYNKGTYNVNTNKWTVDTSSTADYSVKFVGGGDSFTTTGSQTNGTSINADNATFMFIPQEPGAGAVMEIVFNNGDDTETLTGKIEGDIWDKGKTVNYKLSIDEDFTLKVEPDPTAKKLDAHYIITDVYVTVEGISNWKISASADDGKKVTIIPYDEANPLAQQGFWTDVVVDENGIETSTSARGETEKPGTGNINEKRFLVFIPENISDKDRQITITLESTEQGSTAKSSKVLLQKYPNWTGNIGWEVVDDDERGKYGFKWTREVSYVWPYSYTHTLGIGSNYSRSAAAEELNKIVSPYTNGQTLSVDFTKWQNQFISFGEFLHKTTIGIRQDRAFIYLNYKVLNNIVQGEDKRTNGYANTETLYTSGGTASSLALELAIQTTIKKKGDDAGALAFSKVTKGDSYSSKSVYDASPATNIPYEKGTLDDLSGILSYILKKNRYCLQIIETENGYSQHAYFQIKDLKWFLPAVDEFPADVDFTPENTTDSAADYWSSTIGTTTSTAFIGSGAEKDRDLEYQVIAVRKNENGVSPATVVIDNSSIAGGENGDTNQWL